MDYLGHKYTGITISTKMCFRISRIEIKAKLPKGYSLSSVAFITSFEKDCYRGERDGQVDIAKFISHNFINFSQSTLHYGSNFQDSRDQVINYNDWIEFGIELTDKHLQTFMNGKVVYHANRIQSQWGKYFKTDLNRYNLPFGHPFILMLHIGVRSFQIDKRLYPLIDEKRLKTWILPVFEIDFVKVYGEVLEKYSNETLISITSPQIDSSILYAFIGSIVIVLILVIFIIIGIVYIIRKRRQTNNEENYDDLREVDNKYEDFNYDYAYEVVHYADGEINQGSNNSIYLVLTDPMDHNQNQVYEEMIDLSKV